MKSYVDPVDKIKFYLSVQVMHVLCCALPAMDNTCSPLIAKLVSLVTSAISGDQNVNEIELLTVTEFQVLRS